MTLDEFFEKLKAYEWQLKDGRRFRTQIGHHLCCPLEAVFGWETLYAERAKEAGLPAVRIISAADWADTCEREIRRRMLELVKP